MKETKEERLLDLLADGRWHGGRELALKVSHRFGAYLFRLKEKGYNFEKRLDPNRPRGEVWYEYRWTAGWRLMSRVRSPGTPMGDYEVMTEAEGESYGADKEVDVG